MRYCVLRGKSERKKYFLRSMTHQELLSRPVRTLYQNISNLTRIKIIDTQSAIDIPYTSSFTPAKSIVLIPLFWTAAGMRGAIATVALAAVKAVATALFWMGAAIWRVTFERSALMKGRDAIVVCRCQEVTFWKVRSGMRTGGGCFFPFLSL